MPSPAPILAIDPGLQTTGYALLQATANGPKILEAGVIRSAKPGRDTSDLANRVKILYIGLVDVLDQWEPCTMAVEQLFAHPDHPRTSILMAHARGAFFLAAAQRGIPTASYSATRIKKTVTGHGRADKIQIQAAVARELGLSKPPEPHDVADALAIALCHYYTARGCGTFGVAKSMSYTAVNREALLGEEKADHSDDGTTKGTTEDEAA